jgi:YVTN family beta-propeller protein
VRTEQLVWKIDFHHFVTTTAIETGPDGSTRRLFTPLGDLFGFAVVDFAAHKQVAFIKLPNRPVVKLGPPLTRRNAYPTHGSAVSPDGKILAVSCRGYNGVFLYSLPKLKRLAFISTPTRKGAQFRAADGGDPGWVAFTPDSKMLYVANAAVDSVSAIDVGTRKQVAVIPVGRQPDHVFTFVRP